MKAQRVEFNGEWHKDCRKCGGHYASDSLDGLTFAFQRDARKGDGLDAVCKACRAAYRAQNRDKERERWSKYYAPGSANRKRHMVRSQTRRKYGSAKGHVCAFCEASAEEWHHIEYSTDMVVALCHACHEAVS